MAWASHFMSPSKLTHPLDVTQPQPPMLTVSLVPKWNSLLQRKQSCVFYSSQGNLSSLWHAAAHLLGVGASTWQDSQGSERESRCLESPHREFVHRVIELVPSTASLWPGVEKPQPWMWLPGTHTPAGTQDPALWDRENITTSFSAFIFFNSNWKEMLKFLDLSSNFFSEFPCLLPYLNDFSLF